MTCRRTDCFTNWPIMCASSRAAAISAPGGSSGTGCPSRAEVSCCPLVGPALDHPRAHRPANRPARRQGPISVVLSTCCRHSGYRPIPRWHSCTSEPRHRSSGFDASHRAWPSAVHRKESRWLRIWAASALRRGLRFGNVSRKAHRSTAWRGKQYS